MVSPVDHPPQPSGARIRGGLWKTLEPGDRIIKRSGETAPVKIG
jgi:hypothetical protein